MGKKAVEVSFDLDTTKVINLTTLNPIFTKRYHRECSHLTKNISDKINQNHTRETLKAVGKKWAKKR